MNKHCKNNPEENPNQLRKDLKQAVKDKKNGETCFNCGQEIWAIGSAVAYQSCFSCLTGEADSSEDYEINEVCWS
ncbi:hypothetical protein [Lentibacillus amyloliquefaciens]|uniref:hypothetical protein n=1 Tax=Lentibacillus amyloliquefaciens TaxID=1472767 RepID=UPI001F35D722|nr:hypothetical protein [Lentibacillus amyloliquefaciens]